MDLFNTVIDESKCHPQFVALRDSIYHDYVRSLMNELYSKMGDPNGNFVPSFQGNGFHSLVFELACFAYLEFADYSIDRSYESPDFLASRGGIDIAIEVTTPSPSDGQNRDISIRMMEKLSQEEIEHRIIHEFQRRTIASLRKKLAHRYHTRPHCSGKPLVFITAPFFEAGSTCYIDESLVGCLYGSDPKSPTPCFFELPDAKHVSAVIYCNAFTVPRFFRLATDFQAKPNLVASRKGIGDIIDKEDGVVRVEFEYQVGDPYFPKETWAEGVTIFKNPNALCPLPDDALPCTRMFSASENAFIDRICGEFHPLLSSMIVHCTR